MTGLDEYRFFQTFRRDEQQYRYARGDRRGDSAALAREIEGQARAKLEGLGYRTAKTGHNDPFDLWCEGVRVEVKASRWADRYQANMRGNRADVCLFACVNGSTSWFVIPWEAIGDRRTLEVWSEDPGEYAGQWARYRDAWGVVDGLVKNPPANAWQLPLF